MKVDSTFISQGKVSLAIRCFAPSSEVENVNWPHSVDRQDVN